MLEINKVHPIIEQYTGIKVFRSGQTPESVQVPYCVYTPITEGRYKDYNVLRQLTGTSPVVAFNYKSPSWADIQYDLIFDSKGISNSLTKVNQFYNLFLTYGFKNKTKLQNIFYTIISNLTEVAQKRDMSFERRFMFEVRYFWAEIFTDAIDAGGGAIETISPLTIT